jgi:hypothetical protein
MEIEGSLSCSQWPAIRPYPDTVKYTPAHLPTNHFHKIDFNIVTCLVTLHGYWIDNWIYWITVYTLQFNTVHFTTVFPLGLVASRLGPGPPADPTVLRRLNYSTLSAAEHCPRYMTSGRTVEKKLSHREDPFLEWIPRKHPLVVTR